MRTRNMAVFLAAVAGIGGVMSKEAKADVTLPTLISEGMVLQQKAPVRIYGKATPGEEVSVTLQGKTTKDKANSKGNWEVVLKSLAAGGPFPLTVQGKNKIELKSVYVGEVWVCSGQSNMEWVMAALPEADAKADVAASANPLLRMFTVTKKVSGTPREEVAGTWQEASPQNTPGFSAVGYYFARALRAELKVPVGMIHTSWGGTRIEAWTSRGVLRANGAPLSEFDLSDPNSQVYKNTVARYNRQVSDWKTAGSPEGVWKDPGPLPTAKGWEATDYLDNAWGRIIAPGAWENAGVPALEAVDGGIWFRKTIKIPADLAGKPMTLTLGAIDDDDITYVNGVKVGATGPGPDAYAQFRKYPVPAELLKAGNNVIAVRVWDSGGAGGFTGQPGDMRLTPDDPTLKERVIALNGEWRWQVEISRPQNPGPPPQEGDPNMASGLYNGMLYPLRKYGVQGYLWYQGESNAGNPMAYRRQLPALIQNWRTVFDNPEATFLIVQLASFMAIQEQPQESGWAALREAQSHAAAIGKKVGTSITTDAGDVTDIHPHKKKIVGERLALLARKIAYRQNIDAESPVFEKMEVRDGKAVLTFKNVGDGLEARAEDSTGKTVSGGKLLGFAIAGAEGRFIWGDAMITGKDEVTVSAPTIPVPVTVRFGWADYPVVNLYNKAGLPASPFRTDAPVEMTEKMKKDKKAADKKAADKKAAQGAN